MTSFSTVNVSGSENYRPDWQRQHLIPTQLLTDEELAGFFQHLKDAGYNHDNFDFNGILLPSQNAVALAEGFALHRGSHPQYTQLVDRLVTEVKVETELALDGGQSVQTAYQEALRKIRGIQAYLMDAHVVSSEATNPLTGEPSGRALFMINRKDPWRAVS